MGSLSVKYRPGTFDDVVGQNTVVKILKKQIETNNIRNSYLFAGASGCVDCYTEYFNGFGWVPISEYKDGDKVLVYDSDGSSHLECPSEYIVLPTDTMHTFSSFDYFKMRVDPISMCLSDEHRVIYHDDDSYELKEMTCSELIERGSFDGINLISTFSYGGSGVDLSEDLIRLTASCILSGEVLVDGTGFKVIYTSSHNEMIRIAKILHSNGIPYSREQVDQDFMKITFNVPELYCVHNKAWYNSNSHQLSVIVDELTHSGIVYSDRRCLFTHSKESADFIQFAFTATGNRAVINKKIIGGGEVIYIISVMFQNGRSVKFPKDTEITTSAPDDFCKYCFKVSTGMWIMRRNGCIFVTGNCGKTTLARIFSHEINKYTDSSGNVCSSEPIEIDGASNNGVDNVKNIISASYERSLDGKYKVFIIDECVTGDTEVLTDTGFKKFKDLTHSEKVAQYNDDGTIEFVQPTEWIEENYSGKMYKLIVNNRAVMMSPNHVQPMFNRDTKYIQESYIKDLEFNKDLYFIESGRASGTKNLSDIDRLAIIVNCRGKRNLSGSAQDAWSVVTHNNDEVNHVVSVLNSIGLDNKIKYSKLNVKIIFNIPEDFNISERLDHHFKDFSDVSYSFAEDFINEVGYWGNKVDDKKSMFYETRNVEDYNIINVFGSLCGHRVYVCTDKRKHKNKDGEIEECVTHRVSINKREYFNSANSKKVSIKYSGKIYCVKVPSHKIIIRSGGMTFVTGNCHALTNQAWQAFLKCIEEPPEHTVFLFCTTDPQKLPETILNRVMRFDINKINIDSIKNRLMQVCSLEGFSNYEDTCNYISKLSNGCMRDALTMIDKVSAYDTNLSVKTASEILGRVSYDIMFTIINNIIDGNDCRLLSCIDEVINTGADMQLFITQFLSFILDMSKYILFKNMGMLSIPNSMENDVIKCTNFQNSTEYYSYILNKVLSCKNSIKNDVDPSTTVQVELLNMCRLK